MQIILVLIVLTTIFTFFYMRQAKFGKLPAGERLAKIEKSAHYKDGSFRNLIEKPTLTEGHSIVGELYKTLFIKYPNRSPVDALPSVKTDLDWAIMECGQYNEAWQAVHELPQEVAQATVQLQAKNMLPVHHSKFTLANHAWNEPLNKITEFSSHKPYRLATPMIGEVVSLNDPAQVFTKWWEAVN